MITRFPTRATVAACVCFVLASLGLTLFVWRSVGGSIPFGAKRYEVRALFSDAGQLAPNADVRISGVNVGKVTGVRQRGLRTEATLSIEPRYAPLPADVRAILRQKTLLGETFVALSTGSRDGPRLADGGTIPVDRIEPTQPLDRVMSTLDAKGREQLHELLVDTGTLLDGRAQDLGDTLGNLGPGMRRLEAVTEVLDSQRDDVTRLVSSVGDVLQTVGDERAAVRELVGAGNRALAATASRDDELTATVRAAPALLRELRRTTAAVERTAQVAAPVLRDFRPVAPRVAPALEAMQRATPDIEGLLSDLQAMLPTARRALPAAGRVVDALGPFMDQLQPAAQHVTPMLSYINAYRRELVAAMANVSAAAKGTAPGVSGRPRRYLRTIIPLGPESLVGATSRIGSNRHNAYMAPGGLDHLKDGLRASNCANAAGSPVSAPACKEQEPWSYDGQAPKRYFQRLTERPVVPEPVDQVRSMLR
jgi:virulence factor Mce-like protein